MCNSKSICSCVASSASLMPVLYTIPSTQNRTVSQILAFLHQHTSHFLPISMAGYTYYRYLTYLTELLLIMLTYNEVLTWFLHVLLLCHRWPQSEHLIGDSSGLRKSLCRRSHLLRGRPGCRFVTTGGLVTPLYFTLSMHAVKMLFLYISCTYSNL